MVQPQSPLLLPVLILVRERRGFENRQNSEDLPRARLAHRRAIILRASICNQLKGKQHDFFINSFTFPMFIYAKNWHSRLGFIRYMGVYHTDIARADCDEPGIEQAVLGKLGDMFIPRHLTAKGLLQSCRPRSIWEQSRIMTSLWKREQSANRSWRMR